jgi:hypothetical protein
VFSFNNDDRPIMTHKYFCSNIKTGLIGVYKPCFSKGNGSLHLYLATTILVCEYCPQYSYKIIYEYCIILVYQYCQYIIKLYLSIVNYYWSQVKYWKIKCKNFDWFLLSIMDNFVKKVLMCFVDYIWKSIK